MINVDASKKKMESVESKWKARLREIERRKKRAFGHQATSLHFVVLQEHADQHADYLP